MEQPTPTSRRLPRIRRSPVLRAAALAGALAALVATVGTTAAASAAPVSTAAKPSPKAVQPLYGTPPVYVDGATTVSVPPGGHNLASAVCPAGYPSGGGGHTGGFDTFITDTYAVGTTWYVRATNTGTTTSTLQAFAAC